jgi:hypothetical protein
MDVTERQISISVLERLRDDLTHAGLNNGKPMIDLPDLRQYICERMDRIRTKALAFSAMNTSPFHDSPRSPKLPESGMVKNLKDAPVTGT